MEWTLLSCWPPGGGDKHYSSLVLLGPPRCQPLGAFFVRAPMDQDEVHLHETYASHLNMDAAFCARMRTPYAYGHRSRTRERAGWCHHYAWNAKP
jgi:hypothetical protein